MKYTRAIYYKDGTSDTLTKAEEAGIKERLLAGDKFIEFQGEFISADTVARIGKHHATSKVQDLNNKEVDFELLKSGRHDLHKKRRELIKAKAIASVNRGRPKILT